MKKNYLAIAKGLGIILPVCLIASASEASASNGTELENKVAVHQDGLKKPLFSSNSVKDRIVQSYNCESEESPYQITHTNVHANYTVPHTNVHTDRTYKNKHTNSHSNTPAKRVNQHSNSNF